MTERERLRQHRADWIADGLPPELWDKTYAGHQLAALDAFHESISKIVTTLQASTLGRFTLWLSKRWPR